MDRREQIIQLLKGILNKNLEGITYSAFIFGSQANKTSLKRSDIDIGIMANDITQQQLAQINAEIEDLPMLYKIDLVNFNEVDPQFRDTALKNIELL